MGSKSRQEREILFLFPLIENSEIGIQELGFRKGDFISVSSNREFGDWDSGKDILFLFPLIEHSDSGMGFRNCEEALPQSQG